MPSIYREWVAKATELTSGQEIFIESPTRTEARAALSAIHKELRRLKELSAHDASTLIAGHTFRDHRHWIYIRRTAISQHIGFLKDPSGTIRRISLSQSEDDRIRRLQLMLLDGWTREQLEEEEGPLTKSEIDKLFTV